MGEIFLQLDHEDRIHSSAVCWSWRESFFYPHFWKKIKFTLSDPEKISWANILAERFGHSVEHVTVECHTPDSGSELNQLLKYLGENRILRQLLIEPTLATVTDRPIINFQPWINPILRSIQQIIQSSRQLEALTLGFIEELVASSDILVDMLAQHHGRHLTHLGLASVRRRHQICQQVKLWRFTFERFESIKYLTIDYDDLNDAVLESLTSGTLERLVVHVHETSKDHPGTSNAAWKAFREKNKHCELHLTFVRAHKTIDFAHETILKAEMPLTHFKALFCESSNMPLITQVGIWYRQTIKSVIWMDSANKPTSKPMTDDTDRYRVLDFFFAECPKFKEAIYLGQVWHPPHLTPVLFINPFTCYDPTPEVFEACPEGHVSYEHMLNGLWLSIDHSYHYTTTATKELYKIARDALRQNSEEVMLPLLLRNTK